MPITDLLDITLWAALIEFVGALLIIAYILAALLTLLRTRDVQLARLQGATGAVTGLSFKLRLVSCPSVSTTIALICLDGNCWSAWNCCPIVSKSNVSPLALMPSIRESMSWRLGPKGEIGVSTSALLLKVVRPSWS